MDKKFEQEMHGIGLHEGLWGGTARLDKVAAYFDAKVIETPQPVVEAAEVPEAPVVAPAEVVEAADEEDALLEALYAGPALTEELLEYLESTDWDEATEEELDDLIESIADKDVSEDLVERVEAFLGLIQERKAFRVVKGKKKRVSVKVGGAKQKAHREYMKRMRKGGRRAKVRRLQKKRSRKATAKMAARRTAKYHEKHASMKGTFTNIVKKAAGKLSSVAKKVKEKAGVGSKSAKTESELMSSLRSLLEDVAPTPTERDAILVTMGSVAESLEVIFNRIDPEVSDFMGEQYVALANEYLEGSLHESKLEDDGFLKRVGAYAKLVGKCMTDLEKKF